MSGQTNIEWADSTFNPWVGCTKVSPACDHCYAEAQMSKRLKFVAWGAGQKRKRTADANWRQPVLWNNRPFYACTACGWRGDQPLPAEAGAPAECATCESLMIERARRRVFCASLADVFDNEVPTAWRIDLFRLIAATPNLDWLLLTKRIGNAWPMMLEVAGRVGGGEQALPNVWLGATICNQDEADRDIPKLLAMPAAVRFVSIEPMLGAIDLWHLAASSLHEIDGGPKLDWVIAGGESGPHARPSHPDWFRSLRDQCAAAGVSFLFKQWGEFSLDYDRDRDDPDWCLCNVWDRKPGRWINLQGGHGFHGERVHYAHRVGKKNAGRLLDDVEHSEFPRLLA